MKNKFDVLKSYGMTNVADQLSKHPDLRWDVWKELDPTRGIINVGIFGYDHNIFPFHMFALPGGIITGSDVLHEQLTEYGIEPVFHSWYQDNVFLKMACIPTDLIAQRNLLKIQVELPY